MRRGLQILMGASRLSVSPVSSRREGSGRTDSLADLVSISDPRYLNASCSVGFLKGRPAARVSPVGNWKKKCTLVLPGPVCGMCLGTAESGPLQKAHRSGSFDEATHVATRKRARARAGVSGGIALKRTGTYATELGPSPPSRFMKAPRQLPTRRLV